MAGPSNEGNRWVERIIARRVELMHHMEADNFDASQ